MIWIDFNLGKCFKKIVTMVEVVISNYLKLLIYGKESTDWIVCYYCRINE